MTYKGFENSKPPIKVNVTITQTLSIETTVEIDDYTIDRDEDNNVEYNYSTDTIKDAVKEQIELPSNIFKNWSLEEEEII